MKENSLMKHCKTVSVNDIQAIDLYQKIVGVLTRKQHYIDAVDRYGQLGIPVVCETSDGKFVALTHIPDIDAARELGLPNIDVAVRNISEEDKIRFILATSLYQNKEYAAMSIAIDHVLEYLNTDAGKKWATCIPGDKEEKLAYILGTNRTAIKRFLSIAKNQRDDLNLVQNGEMTWDDLIKRGKELKQENKSPLNDTAPRSVITVSTGQELEENTIIPAVPVTHVDEEYEVTADTLNVITGEEPDASDEEQDGTDEAVDVLASDEEVTPDEEEEEVTYDAVSVTNDPYKYEFAKAILTLTDGKEIEIVTTPTGKELRFDGKKVDANYSFVHDLGRNRNTEYHTTFFMPGDMGECSFQIIFDNPKRLFN